MCQGDCIKNYYNELGWSISFLIEGNFDWRGGVTHVEMRQVNTNYGGGGDQIRPLILSILNRIALITY